LRLHELSSIDSIWFHSEHWRMSVTAELLQSLWEWRCENLSLSTAIKLHHSCDALIFLSETWCVHDQIEDQCLTTPVKAFTPSCIQSPAHLISMADLYWFTPETYIFDLMKLSDSRDGRGMLILDLLFLKHLLKPFKLSLLRWWYMLLSISFHNRWDFPCANNDFIYPFFPKFSIFTGMFAFDHEIPIDYCHLHVGFTIDIQFVGSKLSFGRKHLCQDNGKLYTPQTRII